MRLADDRRGRVPFALLGVVLLLGSVTLVATRPGPSRPVPAVDSAVQDATTATQTAVRDAALAGGRHAAQAPVTVAANTPYGRVVDSDTPFEDLLALRIYLAARPRLRAVSVRTADVSATATVPAIRSPADARRAVERVTVSRASGGRMTVTVQNVTVTARRDGGVVGRRTVSPTVTVDSPALSLHDRVERFERRLNAGPLEPGLGARMTVQLYAVAWARGYAQYGGANVSNVIANRHVALAVNGGALAVQRSTLGASDPESERAQAWAAARVGATDLLHGLGVPPADVASLEDTIERSTGRATTTGLAVDRPPAARPNATLSLPVGQAADTALAGLDDGGIDAAIERAYGVDLRPVAAVDHRDRHADRASPPGSGWTRVDTERSVEFVTAPASSGPAVSTPAGWRRFGDRALRVTRRRVEWTTWRRGNERRRTRAVVTDRYRVTVAVVARHSPDARVSRRGLETVYRRSAPVAGPNLADVRSDTRAVVAGWGGYGSLARTAVTGDLPNATRRVGATGDDLRPTVRRDVVALHRTVRNTTVELPRGRVGTYAVSPAARLADRLVERRAALVDAPTTYAHAAEKARTEARRAYIDAVVAALRRRAEASRTERTRFRETLAGAGVDLERLRRIAASSDTSTPGDRSAPAYPVTVDTAPEYLTLERFPVDRLEVADPTPTHPLVARNLNVFSVPYGQAATDVTAGAFDAPRVRLSTAAATLRAVDTSPVENATLARQRGRLRRDVRRANGYVAGRLAETLVGADVATPGERHTVVATALDRWETPAARALALSEGRASVAIARTAVSEPVARATLAARLNRTLADALTRQEAQVPRPVVTGTTDTVRSIARRQGRRVAVDATGRVVGTAAERAAARLSAGRLDAVPAGLPVAPVPGYWYATVNVWRVEASGVYERVSVRAERGLHATVYTRDGSRVAFDVDGDGATERLGRAGRVSFETGTTVVVVVPAGGTGVGDTDGVRDERSAGWPTPG